MFEYIVSTSAKTYIKQPGNMGFLHIKTNDRFYEAKTHLIAYRGKNEIKAKYIALKTHYNNCIAKDKLTNSNEYGMVMLIMDINHYEEQHPEWCI